MVGALARFGAHKGHTRSLAVLIGWTAEHMRNPWDYSRSAVGWLTRLERATS